MSQTQDLLQFLRAQRVLVGDMENQLSYAISAACEAESFERTLLTQKHNSNAHETLRRALKSKQRALKESLLRYNELARQHANGLADYYETGAVVTEAQFADV